MAKSDEKVMYSYEELCNGHKRFGVAKECVMAALRGYKTVQLTVDEAQKVITKFMNRKVI